MRVVEVCACGAMCDVRDPNQAAIKVHLDDWRGEHRCPALIPMADALHRRAERGDD